MTLHKGESSLLILVPTHVLIDGLLPDSNKFDRFIVSNDLRILICDCVLIKLDKNKQDVEDIGCIVKTQNHSMISYDFKSLLVSNQRKQISNLLDLNRAS